MVKLAYLDCLFIGEINHGLVCHEEALSCFRKSGCCAKRTPSTVDEVAEENGRKI